MNFKDAKSGAASRRQAVSTEIQEIRIRAQRDSQSAGRGAGGFGRSQVRTRPGHLMKDLLKSLDYFLKTIRLYTVGRYNQISVSETTL